MLENQSLPPKVQELSINELRSGLKLAADVTKTDGQLLVGSHEKITPRMLEQIKVLNASNEIDNSVLTFY